MQTLASLSLVCPCRLSGGKPHLAAGCRGVQSRQLQAGASACGFGRPEDEEGALRAAGVVERGRGRSCVFILRGRSMMITGLQQIAGSRAGLAFVCQNRAIYQKRASRLTYIQKPSAFQGDPLNQLVKDIFNLALKRESQDIFNQALFLKWGCPLVRILRMW